MFRSISGYAKSVINDIRGSITGVYHLKTKDGIPYTIEHLSMEKTNELAVKNFNREAERLCRKRDLEESKNKFNAIEQICFKKTS